MGLLQVLGIRSRDAPAITDSVRDSGQTFMFGKADSGERVDEKSAMQIATVYACVRLLAETVAGLPLHLYRSTDSSGLGKERASDHPLYKLLYRQPNPEMTSFSFRETMMTHLLLWGNAYAQIIRDGKNSWHQLPMKMMIPRPAALWRNASPVGGAGGLSGGSHNGWINCYSFMCFLENVSNIDTPKGCFHGMMISKS